MIKEITEITCVHNFQHETGSDSIHCEFCKWYPVLNLRSKCFLCYIVVCKFCLKKHWGLDRETIKSATENNNSLALERKNLEIDKLKFYLEKIEYNHASQIKELNIEINN